MNTEESRKQKIRQDQTDETVAQDQAGVTVRSACIACACGRKHMVVNMYKCLYCDIWFCVHCAERHFGKTREQYRDENPIAEVSIAAALAAEMKIQFPR